MTLSDKPNDPIGGGFKVVSPSYFRALQLRLLGGRYLDDRDREGAPLAIVANESFVRSYFEGSVAKAVGQRVLIQSILPNRRSLGPQKAWEIVGVVADEKSSGLESPNDRGTYASYLQNPVLEIGMVVRGDAGAALIPAVRRALAQVEKTQVLDQARTLDEMKSESLAGRRLTVSLLGGFAVLALVLACTGIYAVLSFVTARRTQELGIRSALGATRTDLIRLVIGGGVRPVAIGIGAGLAGSVVLARYMSSLLFETQPTDPLTLASVSVLFLVVALLACFVPAWRASRIEPMSALRQD
jgi:ABC-type antimicrobial peptide transport system permease subunit